MAKYDFEYDAGKGLNSGLAYMKKNIIASYQQPLERNRMGSYTIGRATKERDTKRGQFKNLMSQVPTAVRISMPKF